MFTEHGVVYTRQSTDATGRISLSMWLARAVCTWKYGALFRYGPRIWQSLSLCLGVACGVRLDFRGDATGAILGSTVDTCSASASRGSLTNFTYFPLCGGLVSCSIVAVLTQNGEVCPADAPVYGFFRAAHAWKCGHSVTIRGWQWCGDLGHFCCNVAAFFGLFFGVELPGQCTGTGPCVISLSDLYRRGAYVVTHIPSR